MAIAPKLKHYLEQQAVDYRLVPHAHSESSMVTAAAAHVPGHQLAKAVIVNDGDGYLMIVVPADYHVHLGLLHNHLGRSVGLATEEEVVNLFPDCDEGAIPPVGQAYDVEAYVDSSLLEQGEIYFEAGDHEHLVKVTGEQFRSIHSSAKSVNVGQHV